MRYCLVILALIIVFVTGGDAQLLRRYGFKVAVTSADQSYENQFAPHLQTKRRIGFNFGAFIEWLNLPVLSVLTQVEYAQKGMGLDFVITDADPTPISVTTLYSRLDYLSIPILAKLRLQSQTVSPYFLLGPRADFLLGFKSDEDIFKSVYDEFNRTGFGGTAGIGLETERFLPVPCQVEFRYNFDLKDSFDNTIVKVSNNAFDFWFGVGL